MSKKELIDLTDKLYRLTLLFPKKEPLRYKIRELADEILAGFCSLDAFNSQNPGSFLEEKEKEEKRVIFEMEKNLMTIDSYFEVAKWQNWVNYFEILEFQEKYDKIKSDLFKKIKELEIKDYNPKERSIVQEIENKREISFNSDNLSATGTAITKTNTDNVIKEEGFSLRKEKILKILEKFEKVQIKDVKKLFPEVSKRTLRRDFQKLTNQGLVERIGEKSNTFYRIRNIRTS